MSVANEFKVLGKRHKIIDGPEKLTGSAQYTGDLNLPGMLHARPVLSPYAHAKINGIDKTAALAIPGVVAVLTAADLPSKGIWPLPPSFSIARATPTNFPIWPNSSPTS